MVYLWTHRFLTLKASMALRNKTACIASAALLLNLRLHLGSLWWIKPPTLVLCLREWCPIHRTQLGDQNLCLAQAVSWRAKNCDADSQCWPRACQKQAPYVQDNKTLWKTLFRSSESERNMSGPRTQPLSRHIHILRNN